jgi:hypothetical protein
LAEEVQPCGQQEEQRKLLSVTVETVRDLGVDRKDQR